MTYVNLSAQVPDQNTFIADVTLDGSETSPISIPHGINSIPLMFWGQMTACADNLLTNNSTNIPVPFPWYLAADATDVFITLNLGSLFIPCTFRLFVSRPQSSFL